MIKKISTIIAIYSFLFFSCKKDWLDAKPNMSLVVPTKISDYQALLNNRQVFGVKYNFIPEHANGDANYTDARWQSLFSLYRYVYMWAEDSYEKESNPDWDSTYQQIMSSNVVLEGIEKVVFDDKTKAQWESVKGQALFYRAFCFYNLTQEFCKPYGPVTASTDLGIPLKLTTNIVEKVSRGNLQQSYNQIINDLMLAKDLLPDLQEYKTQPTKNAVLGLLARIYLSMENYPAALSAVEESLKINKTLLDYSSLNASAAYPFPLFNAEVIWHAEMPNSSSLASGNAVIVDDIFLSYGSEDLRKTLFFRSNGPDGRRFTGNYRGSQINQFCGIANDELFLIRAECNVRNGKVIEGMTDLNALLKTRYAKKTDGTTTYVDQFTNNETEALTIILRERRKQLILRGVRWSDLRRLNRDERFKITLTRKLNNVTYTLLPDDPRYTFPIPAAEIQLTGIEKK